MIHFMYTVHDSATAAYLRPFFARNKGEALRSFSEAVNDPASQFAKYPAEFTLFEMGTFDDTLGTFDLHPSALPLGKALDFLSARAETNLTNNKPVLVNAKKD